MAEVKVANEQARTIKQQKIVKEKEEDEAIARYNREKQLAEFEKAKLERLAQMEKEKEIQRLREAQEKLADRQGEIDELRAKRAFEEAEREHRRKEKAEYEKRMKYKQDMDVARQKQLRERQTEMALAVKLEQAEFARIVAEQKEQIERFKQTEANRKKILVAHKDDLLMQITDNSMRKAQFDADRREEGRQLRK